MKKRLIYFLACLSLIVVNALLINMAQAQDESEIVDDQAYFSDDASAPAPIMYDDEGNMVNDNNYSNATQTLNNAGPVSSNALQDIDEEDEPVMDMSQAVQANDSEIISGSGPLYNQN